MATLRDFARAVLTEGGFPVTDNNIRAICAWWGGEGSHWNGKFAHNPLNSTWAMDEGVKAGGPVRAYSRWMFGVIATIKNIRTNHHDIAASLDADNTVAQTLMVIANQPERGGWGSGSITPSTVAKWSNPAFYEPTMDREDSGKTVLKPIDELWMVNTGNVGAAGGYFAGYRSLATRAISVGILNADSPRNVATWGDQPSWPEVSREYSYLLKDVGRKFAGGDGGDTMDEALKDADKLLPSDIQRRLDRVTQWIDRYDGQYNATHGGPILSKNEPIQVNPSDGSEHATARVQVVQGELAKVLNLGGPSSKTPMGFDSFRDDGVGSAFSKQVGGRGPNPGVPGGGGNTFRPGAGSPRIDFNVGPNPTDYRTTGPGSAPFRPGAGPMGLGGGFEQGGQDRPGFLPGMPGMGAGKTVVTGPNPSSGRSTAPPAYKETSPNREQGSAAREGRLTSGDDKAIRAEAAQQQSAKEAGDKQDDERARDEKEQKELSGALETLKVHRVSKDGQTVVTEVPKYVPAPKDPPPKDPKKERPDPNDDRGGGGPRSTNDNPNPEDSGGGGNPRAAGGNRYRPYDDGGTGGGVGGPRAYDAYLDPESSGGGNPRSRFEMPNPEDTRGPQGPSARRSANWRVRML